MVERQQPIVTELALADALDQLVNLIEELRADADLRLQITTDGTELIKLTFSATPDVGFPLQREVRSIPAEIVRRVWNENLRDYEIVWRRALARQSLSRPSEQRFPAPPGRLRYTRQPRASGFDASGHNRPPTR